MHPVAQPEGLAARGLGSQRAEGGFPGALGIIGCAGVNGGVGFWDVKVVLAAQPVAQLVAMVLLMEGQVEHVELFVVRRRQLAVCAV